MKTITIPIEVPADLEVVPDPQVADTLIIRSPSTGGIAWASKNSRALGHAIFCQIAAAVEARKPRPPKFGLGDLVEWEDGGEFYAGRITQERDSDGDYQVNNEHWYAEQVLTLVRRAAK